MSQSSARPHVVLITVDSLRGDHVSCAANSPVETPNIDSIGDRGSVFTDAYAQGPFTTFSMPSLFTSRYPTGLEYVEFSESVVGVFPGKGATLTERLSDAGYRTYGFHSNPLLSNLFDFDRGFDVFDADLPFADFNLPGQLKLVSNKLRRLVRRYAYLPADTVTDRSLDAVAATDDEPFFLWTHYMDVHGPYQRKSGLTYYNKYRGERLWQKAVHSPEEISEGEHTELKETYEEEVVYTDTHIGRLVDGVRRASDRPVMVVVTSDHGDGFDEHGYYSHPHEVHDELTHVPLVFDDPTGNLVEGEIDAPTELIGIAPTILDLVGVDIPDAFEGRSYTQPRDAPTAISEAEVVPDYRAALVTERWKYVVDDIRDEEFLYERNEDRSEDVLVAGESPEALSWLREAMSEHRSRDAATEGGSVEGAIDDSDTRDRLRNLGYLE